MTVLFDPADWYWIVANDASQIYSSVAQGYVPPSDPAYQAFLAEGKAATRIASEAELRDVLLQYRRKLLPGDDLPLDKEFDADRAVRVLFEALFVVLNDVRQLKGQGPVTKAQFKDWLRARLA